MIEYFPYVVSAIALVVSSLGYVDIRKQTKSITKKKFHDEAHNAYTVKLGAIESAINRLTDAIVHSKSD